jgi:hypothetical protein
MHLSITIEVLQLTKNDCSAGKKDEKVPFCHQFLLSCLIFVTSQSLYNDDDGTL